MENIKIKREWFISSGEGKVESNYEIDEKKELGSGTYGKVIKAKHKVTKAVRAIKIIPKAKVKNHERFATEIDILKQMDHPNIIKLFETYEDSRNVYLVFEVCEGGELFDRIIAKGHFSESEARNVFVQMMKSLYYCHKNGICHRDLKPENFLFASQDPNSVLKLIDFGLSKVYKPEEEMLGQAQNKVLDMKQFQGRRKNNMTTKAGTPYYIAPEVLTGSYDEKCDIWSAGVILYILLCGYPPFFGQTDPQILDAVKKGSYDFNGPEWKVVTQEAKELITKMLCPNKDRYSSEEVLKHPWSKLNEHHEQNQNAALISLDRLKNYVSTNKFKQIALQYIAQQMNESDIKDLISTFNQLDTNGDGEISIEEFHNGMNKLNEKTAKEIQSIFNSMDADKNGKINYTEFIAASMSQNLYLKEEKVYQAFKMFDKNGDGFISSEEIKSILGNDPNLAGDKGLEVWEKLIKEVDTNGDGVIDYNEFIQLMARL